MQEVVYQFYSLQALAYKPAMMLTSCFPFIFHIYVSKTSFRGMGCKNSNHRDSISTKKI